MVFRIILPLYAVLAVLGILANRLRVSRQIGRDPIVVRPRRGTDARIGIWNQFCSLAG